MNSPDKEMEEPTSSTEVVSSTVPAEPEEAAAADEGAAESSQAPRPAKRRLSAATSTTPPTHAVIEISDTESDDSDVCAVTSYQATADEVKRIRRDYSSTSSSSSDYSSDSESGEDDSVVVQEVLGPRVVRAALHPRANRMDDPKLNPTFKSEEVVERLASHWRDHKPLATEDVTLTCDPFRVCLLHEVLEEGAVINNMVDDMNTLDWSRKKMDLYEFHQTADLASLTWQRSIRGIHHLLNTDVKALVSSLTGLTLTSVSASCSLYGPGDHLLPHDDLLADRRVAFILYLAPWRPSQPPQPSQQPQLHKSKHAHNGDNADQVDVDAFAGGWAAHMGGALQLLDTDAEGLPTHVARSILPRNNTMALFVVGNNTFHQVSEVVSLELPRLSINGWFHGPEPEPEPPEQPPPPPPPPPLPPPEDLKLHHEVVLLSEWVSGAYLAPRARQQVQAQMEAHSEVCLRRLLPHHRHRALLEALRHPDLEWEECGPANARRYERVRPEWLAQAASAPAAAGAEDAGGSPVAAVGAVARLLASTAFGRLLSDCTDLAVGTYARLEVQRWRPGDYTLLPPREHYSVPRLEATLYLGVPPRPLSGGTTTYVAPEEPDGPPGAPGAGGGALVTVPPADNALSLVYCDAGAAGFTKYVSWLSLRPQETFYIVTCTYKE